MSDISKLFDEVVGEQQPEVEQAPETEDIGELFDFYTGGGFPLTEGVSPLDAAFKMAPERRRYKKSIL